MSLPTIDWMQARALALTLVRGAGGGAIFRFFDLPLPWLLGAMAATTVAALAGQATLVPMGLRTTMIAVLGIMLGSAFTPDLVGSLVDWLDTLVLLAIYTLTAGTLGFFYFSRIGGFDPVTAYFSAMPGGLTEMTINGEALGGDARTLVLCHAVRVLIVVFVIPLGYGFFGLLDPVIPATSVAPAAGLVGPGPPASSWHPDLSLQEAAILLVCAVVGSWGARRLRLPASFLLGPMVLSALVHISGLTASSPPQALVALAQVVIGAGIGARFSGISLRSVARTLTLSLGANVVLLGLALAFSWLGAELGGASLAANMLAIAPGGVAEMSLIALALGIDVAFVASSHLIRILLVVVAAPQAFRYWRRKG
jgi:hypothetical protein